MQAAQGFGRRGLTPADPALARPGEATPSLSPTMAQSTPLDDDALAAFATAAREDWAQARADRPKLNFWKRHPGMTALGVMALVFLLITLMPLHISITALRWIRGGLGVGGVFGFGAKRLFRGNRSTSSTTA